MNKKSDIESLINLSKGKYSYNDYLKVKELFKNYSFDKGVAEELLANWNNTNNEFEGKDQSLNHIFEQIQYKIQLEEKKQTKKISLWHYYRQVAAILLIPVLMFSIWYFYNTSLQGKENVSSNQMAQSWVNITAPEGARVEFMLPDSSKGWLNSGSKLKYPSVFGETRKVELTGEAWFDVKHLNSSAFVVSVPAMDIRVLGTQFNVSAYPDDIFTDVTLEKGKIEVNGKSAIFQQTLSPNEKIFFNHQARTVTLSEVDASRFSAWKEGYLIIDNEPLGQVVNRIERWYNVEIDIKDEVLKNYRFKATFRDEPLEEVLKLISTSTPIYYTIEKRATDYNGVFKKKKVTMRLKK
ncbi:MAG: FecR family protein [Draconibacterium sp.]